MRLFFIHSMVHVSSSPRMSTGTELSDSWIKTSEFINSMRVAVMAEMGFRLLKGGVLKNSCGKEGADRGETEEIIVFFTVGELVQLVFYI